MNKIQVMVEYVGHEPFREAFPPAVAFQAIKVQAMKFFSLELAAESKYALQYNGADQADNGHLSSLNASAVSLRLVLKKEVPKGD